MFVYGEVEIFQVFRQFVWLDESLKNEFQVVSKYANACTGKVLKNLMAIFYL